MQVRECQTRVSTKLFRITGAACPRALSSGQLPVAAIRTACVLSSTKSNTGWPLVEAALLALNCKFDYKSE